MDGAAKWALFGIGALVVLPIGVLYIRDKSQRGQPAESKPQAPPVSAPPPAPVATTVPPVPVTTGPSCNLNKGVCFEMLAHWADEATECEKGGGPTFSAEPCPRAGAFGQCRVGGGYAGRVIYFYKHAEMLDQASARSTCEGTFRGSFMPIGAPAAHTTGTPTANAAPPPAFHDISPSEARKLEKAGEKVNQLMKP